MMLNGMEVRYGFKLFEENKDGKLFPLFIGKNEETPMEKWIHAEFIPTKGFAARGGWHIGDMPDAPWLKDASGNYKSRWKTGKRVWCVVAYNATVDYNGYVEKLPKKCITDGIPENGFYYFREVGKGTWSITSDIMVIGKITEEQRQKYLADHGYNEAEAFEPYRKAMEKRMKKA